MKTANTILFDIWKALERKAEEDGCGLAEPNEILKDFIEELGRLGETLRYAECLRELTHEQAHSHILRFVQVARNAAAKRAQNPVEVHRIARDIFFDLGLPTFLYDARIFFPERSRHLFQILVALDLRIESSGVTSTLHNSLINYYDDLSKYFYLLLESAQHNNISDELLDELSMGFVAAVSATAHNGRSGIHRSLVVEIFKCLGLQDTFPWFDKHFPRENRNGQLIMVEGKKKIPAVGT